MKISREKPTAKNSSWKQPLQKTKAKKHSLQKNSTKPKKKSHSSAVRQWKQTARKVLSLAEKLFL